MPASRAFQAGQRLARAGGSGPLRRAWPSAEGETPACQFPGMGAQRAQRGELVAGAPKRFGAGQSGNRRGWQLSSCGSAPRKRLEHGFSRVSAVRLDFWPILTLACRAYRLPPPPQLWLPLVDALRAAPPVEQATWTVASFPMSGSISGWRRLVMRSTSRQVRMILDPELPAPWHRGS